MAVTALEINTRQPLAGGREFGSVGHYIQLDGTADYGRPHLIIPHTLDDNDTHLARGLGWGQAGDFCVSLRDNFDALYSEGEQTPKMMTVAVHCRLAGKPGCAAAFVVASIQV